MESGKNSIVLVKIPIAQELFFIFFDDLSIGVFFIRRVGEAAKNASTRQTKG